MTADELRAWMATHEPSASRLAQRLGVTRQAVFYWRTGRTPISFTTEIALAGLEFELDDLVRERRVRAARRA